jgi:aspartate/glutamate racemase
MSKWIGNAKTKLGNWINRSKSGPKHQKLANEEEEEQEEEEPVPKGKKKKGNFLKLEDEEESRNPPAKDEVLANKAKYTRALAEGNFFPDADDDQWAAAVITLVGVEEGQDNFNKSAKIRLKPEQYTKYHELQQQIASKVKPENHRPTIDLTIKGDAAGKASFGILGGTGPLSDAEMVKKTMENLEKQGFPLDQVHIRLLSAPPPRGKDDDKKAAAKKQNVGFEVLGEEEEEEEEQDDSAAPDEGRAYAGKMTTYLNRMTVFAEEKHHKMALASNTAHGHLTEARWGRRMGRLRGLNFRGLRGNHQVQDLTAKVVDQVVRGKGQDSRPFILGTKEAFKKELYPKKFQEQGVTSVVVSKKEADWLQNLINKAKAEGYDEERARELKNFIREKMSQKPRPTHIVLGCTELPLALGHEGMKELQDEFGEGVGIVDTEEVFAAEYTKMVRDTAGASPEQDEEDLNEMERIAAEARAEFMKDVQKRLVRRMIAKGKKSQGQAITEKEVYRVATVMVDNLAGKRDDLAPAVSDVLGLDGQDIAAILEELEREEEEKPEDN